MNRSVLPPSGVDNICTVLLIVWRYMSVELQQGSAVRALTVSMHLGLIDGHFLPHNLLSAQQSPIHLPKFQMAPKSQNLNGLWDREKNPDILSFSVEKNVKRIPFMLFNVSPFDKMPSYGAFLHYSCYVYLFPTIPGKGVPTMYTYRVHTDRDIPSKQLLLYVYIHPLILCLLQSQKPAPTYIQEKYKFAVHVSPRRRKAYTQRDAAWFPKRTVSDTCISNSAMQTSA